MKKGKMILLQALVGSAPIAYFLSIWNTLPEQVPTHYNSQMEADDYGSRAEMLGILVFMLALSIGISLLITNLGKLDPKKRYLSDSPLIKKISWVLIVFMTLISGFIVYETQQFTQSHTSSFSPKYIAALIALLFVVLGNFMNSIKPNYFIGFRTPWALENEENWRLTHHLGSKAWFLGGLIMFLLIIFLPEKYTEYIILASILPMIGIPFGYSYYLFRQKQRK